MLTASIWSGFFFLGLQFFDYFKDASLVAILDHFDQLIIQQKYTKAFETKGFFMNIHAMVVVSILWMVASHLFTMLIIILSCRSLKSIKSFTFQIQMEETKLISSTPLLPEEYGANMLGQRMQSLVMYNLLYMIPMVHPSKKTIFVQRLLDTAQFYRQ